MRNMDIFRTKIGSLEEYKKILQETKNRYGQLLNNAYYFSKALESPINNGCIYAQEIPGGVIFYHDCSTYEKVYIFISSEYISNIIKFRYKKPLLVNIITNIQSNDIAVPFAQHNLVNQLDDKSKTIITLLRNNGFELEDAYFHMKKNTVVPQLDKVDGYQIDYSTIEQVNDILNLLSSNFAGITSDLPTKNELITLIEKCKAFSLTDFKNKLCGYIQYEQMGSNSMIRHLVVDEQHKGKKLGYYLVSHVLSNSNNTENVLWVKTDNIPAYNLYTKVGYIIDGRLMMNYILKLPTSFGVLNPEKSIL